jgi:hypothetical protein
LILRKIGPKPEILQALLLGQAGLLPSPPPDEYAEFLLREHTFLEKKLGLKYALHSQQWKMVGVRPKSFPAIRIAQLCEIIANHPNLFTLILDEGINLSHLKPIFTISLPEYWQEHYLPGKKSSTPLSKTLSKSVQNLLKINFFIPLLYAYGKYIQRSDWQEKPFNLLQNLEKEQNHIIKKFLNCNWQASNAYDSQGMLGLYQNYCSQKKCLECKIGHAILKKDREIEL